LNLDHLRYFVQTAQLEHLGKASRVLSISPSAISHGISQLENEFGLELFIKVGKKIRLTADGGKFLAEASNILRQVEELKLSFTHSSKLSISGYFRFAASHVIAAQILVPAISKILLDHQELKLEILSLRSAGVVKEVLAGNVDIGMAISPQNHVDLCIHTISQCKLVLVAKKSHPLLKLPMNKRINALNKLPAVLPKVFEGIEVCEDHPIFDKYGLTPKIQLAFDNYDVAAAFLRDGNAWSFFPQDLLRFYPRLEVAFADKGWNAMCNFSLIFRKNSPHIALQNLIRESLLDAIS
jgi:LysR family cyn operon transcriptional activator